MAQAPAKKNMIDLFIEGAKQGWGIAISSMLPNVLMAFVLIQILNLTKILAIVGKIAAPVMALWGLPGEALVVLLASFMSMGGAVGVTAGLIDQAAMTYKDFFVVSPAILLMGSLIQYLGRCLGTADANRKYWGWHILICIINGFIGMWIMKLLMVFF